MKSLVKVNIPRELVDNEKSDEEEYEEVEVELVDVNCRLITDYVNLLMVIAPILSFLLFDIYSYQMCEDTSELTTNVPLMGLSYFVYAVYGPLIFCFVSKDFSKAVSQMFTRKTAATDPKNNFEKEICLI